MNNSIFSFKRFKNLFVRDFYISLKPMTAIVGTIFLILLLVFIFLLITQNRYFILNELQGFCNITYYIAFIVGSLFVNATAFRDFRGKERKMSFLMLPSSTLEKVLSQYLLVTVVFTVLVTLAYAVFSVLYVSIIKVFTEYSLDFHNPFNEINWIAFIRLYFPVQLLLLAGAVTFKKVPLFYTGLVSFLFSLLLAVIFVGLGYLLFSGHSSTGVNLELHSPLPIRFDEVNANSFYRWTLKSVYYFLQYGLGILLAFYVWFKVKEKQA